MQQQLCADSPHAEHTQPAFCMDVADCVPLLRTMALEKSC